MSDEIGCSGLCQGPTEIISVTGPFLFVFSIKEKKENTVDEIRLQLLGSFLPDYRRA